MYRYSVRTLLIVVTIAAIALPWLLAAIRRPVTAEIRYDPVRMPAELLPDEHDASLSARRPRLAVREWLERNQFALDSSSSTEVVDLVLARSQAIDVYRGQFEGSKPLSVRIEFLDDYAYVTVAQHSSRFPWESAEEVRLDEPGSRFAAGLHAWSERYYQMEQGIRSLAGVADRVWGFGKGTGLSPGVRYSPPAAPSSPDPLWSSGFYR